MIDVSDLWAVCLSFASIAVYAALSPKQGGNPFLVRWPGKVALASALVSIGLLSFIWLDHIRDGGLIPIFVISLFYAQGAVYAYKIKKCGYPFRGQARKPHAKR